MEISPALVSRVTDAVLSEVQAWQNRPLDAVYPIVYLDAIHLKIRTEGRVQNRAVYVALGTDLTGNKLRRTLSTSMSFTRSTDWNARHCVAIRRSLREFLSTQGAAVLDSLPRPAWSLEGVRCPAPSCMCVCPPA